MGGKSIILKPQKKLILPSEIVVATPEGMVYPPRKIGKTKIGATPAGYGVFAKWAIKILDEKGRQVSFRDPRTGKMVRKMESPVHSFTRNFGLFQRGYMLNNDSALNLNETLVDDGGAAFLCRLKSDGTMVGAASILTGLAKIKFGDSNAALSTTQFNLQGVLLGPVTEAAVAVALVVEDTVQTIFTVTGQITNGTGGVFAVEEMGLFPELNDTTGGSNRTTMMLRDLTGTVNVNNGQSIIGEYTFTIAV
jgi:hypothetical protein